MKNILSNVQAVKNYLSSRMLSLSRDNAKKIYDENRADLEKDCDDEEFMAMYEQYEVFDELEEQFMDMEELVTAQIAEYVDNNIEQFAEIVE